MRTANQEEVNMQESKITESEKDMVRSYMLGRHCGYKFAVPRREIASALGIEDRRFRKIAQELKLTNDIASLSSIGYWFIPLATNDPEEISHLKHSINEDYSRAYKQLKEANTRVNNFKLRDQIDFIGETNEAMLKV